MSSNASKGNSRKAIAIVGHPGNGIQALKQKLEDYDGEAFTWKSMPPVHMLGRNTIDEQKTYDFLLGRTDQGENHYPHGILTLVNANELERQLYLVSQLIDLRLPVVVGLTQTGTARRKGRSIKVDKMASLLGVPVLDMEEDDEITRLISLAEKTYNDGKAIKPTHWRPSVGLANAYHHVDKHWVFKHLKLHTGARLIEGLRLIGVAKALEEYASHPAYETLVEEVAEARRILENKNENWAMAEIFQRNNAINQIIAVTATQEAVPEESRWKRLLKSIFPN